MLIKQIMIVMYEKKYVRVVVEFAGGNCGQGAARCTRNN